MSFGNGKAAMLRLMVALGVISTMLAPAGASAAVDFGFESANAEETTAVAGEHPDLTTSFEFKHFETEGVERANARVEDIAVELPPGLVGSPAQFPYCSMGDFGSFGDCPTASQVGFVKSHPSNFENLSGPLFNLKPDRRAGVARLGFYAAFYAIIIDVSVRGSGDYGVTATVHDSSGEAALISATATIWGVPASPVHDEQRMTTFESFFCETACLAPEGKRASGLVPKPFLSNPTACQGQPVDFSATTYQLPGEVFTASAALPPVTDCEDTSFVPGLRLEPTSHEAGAPTGLRALLRIPQNEAVELPATSAMRRAKVTLPEGMTLNPAAANGLEACSDQQVGLGQEVDSNCPTASKLGTATFRSPALPEAIQGSIYQRTPAAGHLFRIWLVTDEFGLHLKLPGEIAVDPQTGQVSAEFDGLPQLPVEEVDLEFKGGANAPLKNPETCGSSSASYEFAPWSGNAPVVGETQPLQVNQGCDGGAFGPKLEAGAVNPVAGAFSPFAAVLTRSDREDNLASFDLTLPKGQLAKVKGVAHCDDASAATGNCPPASQIGTLSVAAGAGPDPLSLPQPGKAPPGVYLAGPYKGAPYSVVTKVPAQAGPFDLGTVAVRSGLFVDPYTTQATVKTDPLPQILEGVPVFYRKVHALIDRDQFTLNRTNCNESAVTATAASVHGLLANLSDRYQVGECGRLAFQPNLHLRLKGAKKRTGHPAVSATLKLPSGNANISRVQVALPRGIQIDNAHIKNLCTRVQFNENACPSKSVLGTARAFTPLLDAPLEGKVYLRSNGGERKLPDLVVDLRGSIRVILVGFIDSRNGRIRNTFAAVPDAPVDKFRLSLFGGKRGLLVNGRKLCESAESRTATVRMDGQNGKLYDKEIVVTNCK